MEKREKILLDYTADRELHESEKEVISFLIRQRMQDEHPGIRTVAEELFLSTSSVIRLCKKLGFSGYSEFMYHLGLKVKQAGEPEKETVETIHRPIESAKRQFLDHYMRTFDAIDEQSIEGFLQELNNHNKIYLYGAGFSTLFSSYLAKKLELFGFYVYSGTTSDSRVLFLNNISRYQLFIVFSRSGETGKVIEKVKAAKEHGMKTVLFTGNRESTTADLSDFVFSVWDPTIESQREFQVTSYESNMYMLIDIILMMAVQKGIIQEY